MKKKINEEVLCVLKKNQLTNQLEVEYVKIESAFPLIIQNLQTLCDDSNSSLDQLVKFFEENKELDELSHYYFYCESLDGVRQGLNVYDQNTIDEIITRQQVMLLNQENRPLTYDIKGAVTDYKKKVKENYILWVKAYSINLAYDLCGKDKNNLAFSHRKPGWSNPIYKPTTNFSTEIKTNFGYGKSSYFYTILKYKNIEITPFSEWIHYQFAKFYEIVRYSKKHTLKNEYWLEAMEFSKEAYNLSLTDEVEFIEKYIIDECDTMVSGLEDILKKEHFSFKNRENNDLKIVDKKGHALIAYRGEKISGALDFIVKILEFKNITSINSFIERIEACNRKIKPVLRDESIIMKAKILNLNEKQSALYPTYSKVIRRNDSYEKSKEVLKQLMISDGQLNFDKIDIERLDNTFNSKYPEYKEFEEEYKKVIKEYKVLQEEIETLIRVRERIVDYHNKIGRDLGKHETVTTN
jgi:hypothetical protein